MPLHAARGAAHVDSWPNGRQSAEIGKHDMAASQQHGDRRIVVGVGGSPSSRKALRWAIRQAVLTGSVVDAVIDWRDPASYVGYARLIADTCDAGLAAKTLSEIVDSAIPAGGTVTVRQRIMEGHAARVLFDAARGADLLMAGSRGRDGFPWMLLGPLSLHCARHSPCPVVIHPREMRTGPQVRTG
jgi:nucleotide-binding universal stress UspA family protein